MIPEADYHHLALDQDPIQGTHFKLVSPFRLCRLTSKEHWVVRSLNLEFLVKIILQKYCNF